MAKFESEVCCTMDELMSQIGNSFSEGRYPAQLQEKADFRIGEKECAVRVYQRFDFPSTDQDVITLLFADEGDHTYLLALDEDGGSQDYLRRKSHMASEKPGYFFILLDRLLAKYQRQDAG